MARGARHLGDVRVGGELYDVKVAPGELAGRCWKDAAVGVQISLVHEAAPRRRSGFQRFLPGERYALRTSVGKLHETLQFHYPEEHWGDSLQCVEQAPRVLTLRESETGQNCRRAREPVMELKLASPRKAHIEDDEEDVIIEDLGWAFVLGLLDEEMHDSRARSQGRGLDRGTLAAQGHGLETLKMPVRLRVIAIRQRNIAVQCERLVH